MNQDLDKLQPYPFEKLKELLGGIEPPQHLSRIPLSIGEPKHAAPKFVTDTLIENISCVENYPTTKGIPELRQAISDWATERFTLASGSLDPELNVLPVNGTREAIFSLTQAVVDRTDSALVISPNPFYQIYEGATFLAGANLLLLPCEEEHGFVPNFADVTESEWQQCQIVFLCSPGNPTGAVVSEQVIRELIDLSDRYNFVLASDECYSEIYCDEQVKPTGLLEVCAKLGRDDYKNVVVFHSLSKRSNLPGLRSGFVAGDADILKKYFSYRTYHGCAMPLHNQYASIAAWQDEAHVAENRKRYREKFSAVLEILQPVMNVEQSDASFYLWPETPICDKEFAKLLFEQQAVTVVPGSYLAREVDGKNPGKNRVRMALVAPLEECEEAAKRIKSFVESLK